MTITDTYAAAMTATRKLVPRLDAARRLNLSTSQLDTIARAGKLTRVRNTETGRAYFYEDEIDELARKRALDQGTGS